MLPQLETEFLRQHADQHEFGSAFNEADTTGEENSARVMSR
jgi:hypothetical protein